jgi:hypothetical protein
MMVGGKIATCSFTIEDVWTKIADMFTARGRVCEFLHGPQNRALEGGPGRIQFERTGGPFSFSGMRAGDGSIAKITQSCEARIWGLQEGEDFERNQSIAAFGLVVELIGTIYAVAPLFPDGLVNDRLEYFTDTRILKYGESFMVPFGFWAPIKYVTDEEFKAMSKLSATLRARTHE